MASLLGWVQQSPSHLAPSQSAPPHSISSHAALPWALATLPDLGAVEWRTLGEQSLARSDTLSALVFWLRQIASDSLQKAYVTYRLRQMLQMPRWEMSEDQAAIAILKKDHDQKIRRWVRTLSLPAPWHNDASLGALEMALWESVKPEFALKVLKWRMQVLPSTRHLDLWLGALRQLWHSGATPWIWEALNQAEKLWDAAPIKTSTGLNSAVKPSLDWRSLDLIFTITEGLMLPEKAAAWSHRGVTLRSLQAKSLQEMKTALRAAEACMALANWSCVDHWGKQIQGPTQESFQLVFAMALVGQGKQPQAVSLLENLKNSPQRTLSNGALLHAQGWVAAFMAQWLKADSLWTLASGYVEEPTTQSTLEMRRALLLDTNAMPAFLKGQIHSPFTLTEKRNALGSIAISSKLWGDAQWLLAQYALSLGQTEEAKRHLLLVAETPQNPQAIQAKAALARLLEIDHPGQAIAEYESLLVESQQGVPAEFARERLRQMEK
jgi:hypothetical protein